MSQQRLLIINDAIRDRIQEVIAYASHNMFTEEELRNRIANPGTFTPPGDIEGYRCRIQDGFRCVFTIEKQPIGWCKHLSISIDAEDKLPGQEACLEIAKAFGMKVTSMESFDSAWLEEIVKGFKAVNLIRLVEKDK